MERALEVLRAVGRPLSEAELALLMDMAESDVSQLLYRLQLRGLARLAGSIDKIYGGGHGYFSTYAKGLWIVVSDV